MSWNYRVMRAPAMQGGHWFAIYEVYYDEAGKPNAWTESPSRPQGDDFAELTRDSARYQLAVGMPILAIEADGAELYEIGRTGKAKPKLVWKRTGPLTAADAVDPVE